MMIKPVYFAIQELVPRHVYADRGERSIELIDPRLITVLDFLRERYGPLTVNSWAWGGDREWSGLRTSDSPFYSKYSQHTFGRAADFLPKEVSVDSVVSDIVNSSGFGGAIAGAELGVDWVHIDVRNGPFRAFRP